MTRIGSVVLGVAVVTSLASGCEDDCGAGYERFDPLCRVSRSEADGGEGNATPAGGAAGVAGATECEVMTFGQPCLTVEDCECDADFCAGLPGEEGFCTRTGCDTDASVCPSAWECTDLSPFGPDLPARFTEGLPARA